MSCEAVAALLMGAPDAGMLLSSTGQIMRMNSSGLRLFHVHSPTILANEDMHVSRFLKNELVSKDVRRIIADSGEIWWNDVLQETQPDEAAEFTLTGYSLTGRSKFSVTVSVIRLDSACAGREPSAYGDHENPFAYGVFVRRSQEFSSLLGDNLIRLQYTEHAVNEAFDPMFIIDQHGSILLANKAAVKQFGWTLEEFHRGNISMIAGGEHGNHHHEYMENYLRTGKKRVIGKKRRLTAVRKDGSEFLIQLGVTEIEEAASNERRLFCGYVYDLTESEQAKDDMKQKEELLAALIDASFEPMFQINEFGIIKLVNKAAVDIFGYSRDEFMDSNISMIVSGEHAAKHDSYIAQYLKTGKKKVIGKKRELSATKKDGTSFPMELGVSEVKTRSGERLFCGFIRDLTNKKEDEADILHRSQLMDGMINAAFDPMFQINKYGIIQLVNDAAVDLFGWTREEFLGKNISIIVPGEHGANHSLYLSSYLTSGCKRVIGKRRQLDAISKDKKIFPIELGVKEVKAAWGESFFCGFVKDMSSQKMNNERLARKESLTMGMINSAFDAMFQINERGIICMVNQAAVDHFGWSQEEFLGNNISMITSGEHASKHNGYLQRYLREGGKHVIGKRRELTAVRKDGTEFPIELGVAEVSTIWDERFFCGFVRDIRRQKYDENELREKEKLTFGIIQASVDPLLAIDEHQTIYFSNKPAAKEVGWSVEELVGKDLGTILTGDRKTSNTAVFDRHIRRNVPEPFTLEVEVGRKNESTFFTSLRLSEIPGPFAFLLGANGPNGQERTRLFAVVMHGVHSDRKNLMGSLSIAMKGFSGSIEEKMTRFEHNDDGDSRCSSGKWDILKRGLSKRTMLEKKVPWDVSLASSSVSDHEGGDEEDDDKSDKYEGW